MDLEEDLREQVGYNRTCDHTDQTRHHETVVEQVLANHGCARPVEVHRRNIRGIVGDEEVTVDGG